ncbi:hypothetical protein [Clostridioides difficile]|nr:hypothetical protein [Clostridioides difficile]
MKSDCDSNSKRESEENYLKKYICNLEYTKSQPYEISLEVLKKIH